MARHANVDWNLPEGTPAGNGSRTHGWESITAAILMDIRAELRKLNGLLGCPNFMSVPAELRRIEKNTRKRKRRKLKRVA